jgi:hypothetical protein
MEKIETYFVEFSSFMTTKNGYRNKTTNQLFPGSRTSASQTMLANCIQNGKFQLQTSETNVISFEPGDKVITPNWENPQTMFSIKEIATIELKKHLMFNFTDGTNVIYSKPDSYRYENVKIRVGAIRKVSTELNGMKVGDILITKKAGIVCFLKNEPVEIKAFVIDCFNNVPLILCSNYCTLWPKQLEKFEHVPFNEEPTSRYQTLKPLIQTKPIDKIPFQEGDLLTSGEPGFTGIFMFLKHVTKRLRLTSLTAITEYHNIEFYPVSKKNLERFGILNPRISPKDEIKTLQGKVFSLQNSVSQAILTNYKDSENRFHAEACNV